jgi:hypothetical protein
VKYLLHTASISYIFIVDKQIFETDQLVLISFDERQNITD